MSGTFSHTAFWNTVNDLFDKLEELHGIDAVLDGIEARGLGQLYYPANNYEPGGPFNVIIEIGTTYPFKKTIRAVDVHHSGNGGYPDYSVPTTTTSQHDFGWVDEAYAAATSWRIGSESGLGSSVAPLLQILSSRFSDIAYALTSLYATMHTKIREDWSGLANQASEWEGHAADTFFANFEQPVKDVVNSHKFALDYLNSLVCGVKACNDAGQQSLMALATECVSLADDQLRKRQVENRDESSADALVLAATATAIGAALLFPVPGAAAALGSISALLGYAASSVPPAVAEEVTLTARSAPELLSALSHEVTELKSNVRKGLTSIDHKADEMDGYVDNLQEGDVPGSPVNAWIPIRPDIAPGPDFYHESRNYG